MQTQGVSHGSVNLANFHFLKAFFIALIMVLVKGVIKTAAFI